MALRDPLRVSGLLAESPDIAGKQSQEFQPDE